MTATTLTRPARLASPAQYNYLTSLLASREIIGADALATLTAAYTTPDLTSAAASTAITWLLTLPRKPAPVVPAIATPVSPARVAVQPGWYLHGGNVYMVVRGLSGRPYAKRLVPAAHGSAHWTYDRRAYALLSEADLLTSTEAARLGHLNGVCVRCTKALTDIRSNAAGYGQTCAKNMAWPYPTKREAEALIIAEAM